MSANSTKIIKRKTSDGDVVRIRGFYKADEIKALKFSPKFGTYAHYRSLYTRKKAWL